MYKTDDEMAFASQTRAAAYQLVPRTCIYVVRAIRFLPLIAVGSSA